MITHEQIISALYAANKNGRLTNGTHYTSIQIKTIKSFYEDLSEEVAKVNTMPTLSLKRAYLVLLQERFFEVESYPRNFNLKRDLYQSAVIRFNFNNRNWKTFNTPDQVLPKDPCLYYEDNSYSKRFFRESLEFLLMSNLEYFENTDAKESLRIVLEDIKDCTRKY